MGGMYAVLSNFNFLEPKLCSPVASYFKDEGFDGIILNGDLSGLDYVAYSHKSIKKRIKLSKKMKGFLKKLEPAELSLDYLDMPVLKQEKKAMSSKELMGYSEYNYLYQVLNSFAKSDLEVFVNPGASEDIFEYEKIMNSLSCKHQNLVDTVKNPVIKKKDHELVFVPGLLDDGEFEGSFFIDKSYDTRTVNDGENKQFFFGVQSLPSMVQDPERAVLFTSEPPKFYSSGAIDIIRQYALLDDFTALDLSTNKNVVLPKGSLLFEDDAAALLSGGARLAEAFENIGDEFFNMIYKTAGFNKVVVNFSDNAGAAHDWKEKTYFYGDLQKELICSPSNMDMLMGGILKVKEGKCSYTLADFSNLMVLC